MATRVRPTLRVLKTLPRVGDDAAWVLATIGRAQRAADLATKRSILSELRLDDMRHPLLDDLREAFERGDAPDRHESASREVGRTVYEARSSTGAAWRGAAVLEDGVVWLVFADVHDRFHSTAADYLKRGTWRPSALDNELAAQDSVRSRWRLWRVEVLTAVMRGLTEAVAANGRADLDLPAAETNSVCSLQLVLDHDRPAARAELAHTTSGMLHVAVKIKNGTDNYATVRVVLEMLTFIRGEGEQDQSYLPGGDLLVLATVSHARLAQLTAQVPMVSEIRPGGPRPEPSVLHYVNTGELAAGFVNGSAVLSLCGEWFVPRRDSTAELPVCPRCEEQEPFAQALLNSLRS